MTLPRNVVVWDQVRNHGATVMHYGDEIGGVPISTPMAVVIGDPEAGLVVLGGTYDELRQWTAALYMSVIQDENKHGIERKT